MRDQRWRLDMTESPSTGSGGGQSSVLFPDGLPVYREILCPHNTAIQSSRYIDPYIPTKRMSVSTPAEHTIARRDE